MKIWCILFGSNYNLNQKFWGNASEKPSTILATYFTQYLLNTALNGLLRLTSVGWYILALFLKEKKGHWKTKNFPLLCRSINLALINISLALIIFRELLKMIIFASHLMRTITGI